MVRLGLCDGEDQITWRLSSLQQTDNFLKRPVSMETIYQSIPAIHTEERGEKREREKRVEEMEEEVA